jgi:hypothetical protein
MKQINACWLKRIKSLREMLNELDVVKSKRGDLFLKLVDLTKELDDPNLLMDTILLSKEKLLDQLEALKVAWVSEFTDSIEFSTGWKHQLPVTQAPTCITENNGSPLHHPTTLVFLAATRWKLQLPVFKHPLETLRTTVLPSTSLPP